MNFKFFSLVFAILFCIQPLLSDVFDKMNAEQTCVAYKTTKGMFYVSEVDVLGIQCNVPIKKSNSTIQVSIPVDKFNSGNSKRDSEVALILGDTEMIPLRFEASIPKEANPDSIPATLAGKLFIKNKPNDIILNLTKEQGVIRFSIQTKFSTLGLKVESVGPGGLIAKPMDDLYLYGQIPYKIIFDKEK